MIVTDHINILKIKIKQNESQYDLDRKAAEISVLSSKNIDKYEYLTGEGLGLKPSTVEQTKFEYSPLGKIFNKGLSEDDRKEGLLEKLKNIEDINEELLKIKNKTENIKEVTDFVKEPLSLEAKALIEEIRTTQKDVDYRKLKIIGGNNVEYDFSDFKAFNELFRDLYYKNMTINDAEMKPNEFDAKLRYNPNKQEYIKTKNKLLDNAKNFYKGRKKIIEGFKKRIFLFKDGVFKTKEESEEEESEEEEQYGIKKFIKYIETESKEINYELFKNYFNYAVPSALVKQLYETKKKKKNNQLVNVIKSD